MIFRSARPFLKATQSIIFSNSAVLVATAISLSLATTGHSQTQGAAAALIEEVVVTARKRVESLVDTPIAITALSGDAMEARGMTQLSDIAATTPSLTFVDVTSITGSSSASVVYLRGVGNGFATATSEPGVGIYVDGVYMARNVGQVFNIVDLERVEVLRGPQGTLFGRNTVGGAISIHTKKPTDEFSIAGALTAGNYSRLDGKFAINGPLGKDLFGKLSLGRFTRDGMVDRPTDGLNQGNRDRTAARLALRWLPSEKLEINLAVDGTVAREDGTPSLLRTVVWDSAIFNPGGLPLAPPGAAGPSQYAINVPFDYPVDNLVLENNYIINYFAGLSCFSGFGEPWNPGADQTNPACYGSQYQLENERKNMGTYDTRSKDDVWGVTFTVDYEFSNFSLKSITAYRDSKSTYGRDADGSPLKIYHYSGLMDQTQFSQEFQLIGSAFSDKLDWVVGAYYLDEEVVNPEPVVFTTIEFVSGGNTDNTSYAAFAQGTFSITEKLDITAGIRWTRDEKDSLPLQPFTANYTPNPAFNPGNLVLPDITVTQDFTNTTPMLNVAYRVTDHLMTYATFSEGYKSGGATFRIFPIFPATPLYSPEEVESFEVGAKFEKDGYRLNLAAYAMDYENIQVEIFTNIAPVIKNGGEGEVKGLELEAFLPLPGNLFVEASFSYTDAEYTSIDPGATQINLASKFPMTPETQASLSISKVFTLSGGAEVVPRLEWLFTDDRYNDAQNTADLMQPSFDIINAQLAWNSSDGRYGVTVGVENLTDEDYLLGGYSNLIGGQMNVFPAYDRQVYGTIRFEF